MPSPQFYVFYNGRESTEEISEMKLEDAFSDPNPVITLKVKAFDIRYERNSRLLHDCQEMMYYSIFVSKVEVVNMFTEEWNLEEAKRVAAEEARNESKIEAIIEMLKDQLPVEKISKYTKFSVEQIEEIGARYTLL